jgi:hypothetical protein
VERWIAGSAEAAEHLAVSWRVKKEIFRPDSVTDFKKHIKGIFSNDHDDDKRYNRHSS